MSRGWVLSVDQASNSAGVSLWYADALVAHTVCQSDRSTDTMSQRLRTISTQLTAFLGGNLPEGTIVRTVLFEGVQSRLVMVVVGAFMTCPFIDAKLSPKGSFVQSRAWKSFAARRGALGPIGAIKGVRALRDIGFPVDHHRVMSDDVADSILIYLTWANRDP